LPRSGDTQAGETSPDALRERDDDAGLGTPARWLLAEGGLGGADGAPTTLTIANRGAATDVTVTLLFEDGPEVTATFPVQAGARLDLPLAQVFPAAAGRRFSVLVEGADPADDLVVGPALGRGPSPGPAVPRR
jgi:hypothetical protein